MRGRDSTGDGSARPLDVLAIGPHPDDVELFCGGTVAGLVRRGYRVGILDLTAGERASNGTPKIRAAEARAAADVLGVDFRECLGLPDLGLKADQAPELALALRRLAPRLVLAPVAVDRHPDHAAAAQLVERAVFMANVAGFEPPGRHRVDEVLWYPTRVLVEPSFAVDISADVDAKRRAMQCHVSQLKGARPTLVGAEDALQRIEERDRFYGAQLGVAAAEPFVVHSRLGIDDPVAFFRSRSPAFFPERRSR